MTPIGEIRRRLSGRTARDVVIVFTGNALRSVLGFLSNLIAIRLLGPSGFGTLASAHAVMTLSAQAVDFGLSTSSVRYGSKYLETEPGRTALIFKMSLTIKVFLGLPVLALLVLLSPAVAESVFGEPGLAGPLGVAFVGSFFFLLVSLPRSILQTHRAFGRYLAVLGLQGAVQLCLVAVLALAGTMNPTLYITAFAAAPCAAFIAGLALSPRAFLSARGDAAGVIRELLGFGKWVMISTFATMFIMRLDILMLTSMSGADEVGKYAGANQLAYLFPLITGAVTTALLPRATGITDPGELRNYVKGTFRVTPLVLLVALPLLLFAHPLIGYLFGDAYIDAVPIFRVLLVSFVMSVVMNPASLALYSLDRADLLAFMNLAQLGINFFGNLLLIPAMGGLGASVSSLAVRVFGSVYILLSLRRLLFSKSE